MRDEFERVRAETRGEFGRVREWVESKFETVDARFDAIDKRFESVVTHDDLRKNTYALLAANAAIVTIAVTLARLL